MMLVRRSAGRPGGPPVEATGAGRCPSGRTRGARFEMHYAVVDERGETTCTASIDRRSSFGGRRQ